MNPERWARLKEVFDLALDTPEDQQLDLIHTSCSADPELQAEVLQLLRAHATAGGFLEEAAADLHAFLPPAESGPALAAGMVLARRFHVKSFINAGGMGEVYEAWDAELQESVAIKTILPYIAANADIIDRFKQEVRHAREISHPNICRVHELFCHEEPSGHRTWFLSMELLRGPTLLERIRQHGALPPSEALPIAAQLLAGLEAAHARGLVHRDFKSSNIILMSSGTALRSVITDFGLSLRKLPDGTVSTAAAGVGTPGYMAPEQKMGGAVGPLVDQYALGAVLGEMMTGSISKPGGIPAAARRTPGQPKYPATWEPVVRRCMQREPAKRFRDIAAVRNTLLPSAWRRHALWIAAAGMLVVAAFAAMLLRPRQTAPEPCRICDVTQLTPDTDQSESPSLSRDGRFVAYSSDRAESGNLDIFVQALPSGPLRRITHDAARESNPSLSPDGSMVAFRSERNGGGIYLAATSGGGEGRLLIHGGRDPKISPDGRSLLYWTGDPNYGVRSGKLFRLALAGGTPQPIASEFADARYSVWNQDGTEILFTGCSSADQMLPGCFDWWTAKPDGGAPVSTHAFAALRAGKLQPGSLGPEAWAEGRIVFTAIGESKRLSLATIAIDPHTRQVAGAPQWLLPEHTGDSDPATSRSGSIAFTRNSAALHIWRINNALSAARQKLEKLTGETEIDGTPFIGEGGRYLVYARGWNLKRTIQLRDMSTGQDSTVVDLGTPVQSPVIDGSGTWLAYQQTESDGTSAIYAGQRGGVMKRMCRNCTEPIGWYGGSRGFFFHDSAGSGVGLIDPHTGAQQTILEQPGANLGDVSWSPANGFLLFVESRGEHKQVGAVRLEPDTAQPIGPRILVAGEQGTPMHPRWSGDGKTIFYISNPDGSFAIYRRAFRQANRSFGPEIPVVRFHNQKATIDEVIPRVFNLAADGDTLYLNLGEQNSSIQLGRLANLR